MQKKVEQLNVGIVNFRKTMKDVNVLENKMFGINPLEGCILECINSNDTQIKMTASKISSILAIQQPTITPLIKKLEDNGFIFKTCDEHDRRVKYIELTQQGLELAERKKQHHDEKIQDMIMYLGEEDAEIFTNILAKLEKYNKMILGKK